MPPRQAGGSGGASLRPPSSSVADRRRVGLAHVAQVRGDDHVADLVKAGVRDRDLGQILARPRAGAGQQRGRRVDRRVGPSVPPRPARWRPAAETPGASAGRTGADRSWWRRRAARAARARSAAARRTSRPPRRRRARAPAAGPRRCSRRRDRAGARAGGRGARRRSPDRARCRVRRTGCPGRADRDKVAPVAGGARARRRRTRPDRSRASARAGPRRRPGSARSTAMVRPRLSSAPSRYRSAPPTRSTRR